MKRPEGFDRPAQRPGTASARPTAASTPVHEAPKRTRAAAQPPAPTAPAGTSADGTRSSTARRSADAAAEPQHASKQRRVVTAPSARPERSVIRADREARAELRRAARERRRFERAEVRRFTRRSRRRRIAWLSAAGLVVVLGAMLAIAVFSPILSLRTVTVEGVSRISATDVKAALADEIGTPLALLDRATITKELAGFPLIESFTTEVVPPSTLVVSITERQPVGIVADGDAWNLVDPAGVVIESTSQRPDDEPVLRLPAEGTKSAAFRAEVGVLLGLPDDLRARVGWLEATTSDDVTFGLPDVGQRVYWGSAEDNATKAKTLAALIKAQGKGAKVQYNVSAPESPFVSEITE